MNNHGSLPYKKLLLCALAGFSSGMPFFFFISLLPLWLRSYHTVFHIWQFFSNFPAAYAGIYIEPLREALHGFYYTAPAIALKYIGFLNFLQFSYIIKFLWAPIVDRFCPFGIGRRRGWMLLTQICLFVVMTAYGQIDPSKQLNLVVVLSFLLILFSATQDIALDAFFRREILMDTELGLGNAVAVIAYRFSMLVPGSLALVLSDHLQWSYVFFITALFMLVGLLLIVLCHEPTHHMLPTAQTWRETFWTPWQEYWQRRGKQQFIYMLVFLILYKLGDTMAVALANIFYHDMGYSRTLIGEVAQYAQITASIIGGLLGGSLMLKIGINRALWLFGIVQCTSILGYVWLSSFGYFEVIGHTQVIYLAAVVTYEYLGIGLGTAAFIAYMARESSSSHAGAQLAFFSAVAAIPRAFISPAAGWLVEQYGYYHYFWICFFLAIPGMLILFKIAPREEDGVGQAKLRAREK